MSDNRTDIPSTNAPNFEQRVRETLMTYLGKVGNPLDRGLTLRDLIETGVLKIRSGFTLKPGSGSTIPLEPGDGVVDVYEPDLTPPPTPTGFTVSAAISHVFIEHDAPIYTQGHGHLRTRVYGVIVQPGDPLPTFASAAEVGQFTGAVWAMPSNPATTWRLWIKWETVDGVLSSSPAGGTNGLEVTTGQDVSTMVQAMTGPGNPFTILANDTVIGGFTYPAGTYSVRSFIIDGQITNAKIADAAIDDAKVANLSASKIIAGSIDTGEYIQSTGYVAGSDGWRINGDGTAEFSGVVVRGTVYATDGEFKGKLLGGSASTYSSGLGFFSGLDGTTYKWRVGSPTGARIQWDGSSIRVQNADATRLLDMGATGANSIFRIGTAVDIKADGSATFAGELSAATGTFSGELSAATGSFAGALNSATGTFSGALSAATGTFSGVMTADAVNAVNTINLAGQAVTIPTSAYTAGSFGIGSSLDYRMYAGPSNLSMDWVQQVSFSSSGAPVFIFFNCYVSGDANWGGSDLYLVRSINGGISWTILGTFSASAGGATVALTDTPGAGPVIYRAAVWNNNGGLSSVKQRSLLCLEVKR